MTKSQPAIEVFAGLDVSARDIKVARVRRQGENTIFATFANSASGHKALLAFVLERTERVRVCLEASGNFSLDLALALHAHRQVEVNVVNPRRARKFAESLGERRKTDPVDAHVLCEYAVRIHWGDSEQVPTPDRFEPAHHFRPLVSDQNGDPDTLASDGAPILLTQGPFTVCDGNAFDPAVDCNGNVINKTGAVFQLPCQQPHQPGSHCSVHQ